MNIHDFDDKLTNLGEVLNTMRQREYFSKDYINGYNYVNEFNGLWLSADLLRAGRLTFDNTGFIVIDELVTDCLQNDNDEQDKNLERDFDELILRGNKK